ncbi:hypothetical protein TrVE_jg13015 [Triparma verrucosa]|uniref:WW domain-containing protein n=1 Tax=Triparma verrucosa TaxID=1606542 RepID=A0A9W7C167_9STRA|nr:hypothetical protein TrVE_jg13015 [Triparma verrucosa]
MPGYAAPAAGSIFCTECPAGKQSYPDMISSSELASLTADQSPKESAFTMGASEGCVDCAPGKFGDEAGEMLCDACKGNTYTDVAGRQSCDYCPAGKQAENWDYALLTSASNLNDFYADRPDNEATPDLPGSGSAACVPCEIGKFSKWTDGEGNPSETAQRTGCKSCMLSGMYGEGGVDGYTSDAGASTCYMCPAGKHANKTLNGLCEFCTPGKYSNSEGRGVAGCSLCDAYGSSILGDDNPLRTGYISEANATDCLPCAAGKFKEDNECKDCTPGKYSEAAYNTCVDCGLGETSTAPFATCTKCPAGKYADSPGAVECLDCAVGKYSSSAGMGSGADEGVGAYSCAPCGSHKIQLEPGKWYCDWCPAGKYEESSDSNACTECDDGKFRYEDSNFECRSCSLSNTYGYGYGNGVTFDGDADETGTAHHNHEECYACPIGKSGFDYAQNTFGSNACFDCPANMYAGDGASYCSICKPGKTAANSGTDDSEANACRDTTDGCDSSVCEDCDIGKAGTRECVLCTPGKYADSAGEPFCKPCLAGKGSTAGSSGCSDCTGGKYSTGNEDCKFCEAGKVPALNKMTCVTCTSGSWAAQGDDECTDCVAGKYAPENQISTSADMCFDCPAGTTSVAGEKECSDCQKGKYSDTAGAASCTTCTAGSTTDAVGGVTCRACEVGKYGRTGDWYLNPIYSSGCADCEAGKYAGTVGTATCTDCAAGKFSEEGKTTCTLCPVGKHQSDPGQDDCDSCLTLPGQSAPAGSSECVPCGPGTARKLNSDSPLCEACPAGKKVSINTAGHRFDCQDCPAGQTSDEGSDSCSECANGKFAVEGSFTGCQDYPTDLNVCPLGADGSTNKCQYWYNSKMYEVSEGGNSPFLSSCSTLSTCGATSSTSGSLVNTFYSYCTDCAEGYKAYLLDQSRIPEDSIVPKSVCDSLSTLEISSCRDTMEDADETCRGSFGGQPNFCYKPQEFQYCPDGAVCNYLHQDARVTKNGGEESPFGPGCASYTICNIDKTASVPTYDIKCDACRADKNFTEVLVASGRFGSGDDFGGADNEGTYCTGSYSSVCLNVTSWDTCPAKLNGLGNRRMLRGASDGSWALDFSLEGGDWREEYAAEEEVLEIVPMTERKLGCTGCSCSGNRWVSNCDLNDQCPDDDADCNPNYCVCSSAPSPTPPTPTPPTPTPPTPTPPTPTPPTPTPPTPTPPSPSPPTTVAAVSCLYLKDNSDVAVNPGGTAPIGRCAEYKMCDNTDGKLSLQCTRCEDGYRGTNYATKTVGTCAIGENPTDCTPRDDGSDLTNWKNCPSGSGSSSTVCHYWDQYDTWRPLTTSPFVNQQGQDSCGSYQVCDHDDQTTQDTDIYKIMCKECASGYITSKTNTETWGACSTVDAYPTLCVKATTGPTTSPTKAPSPAPPPATPSPTKAPTSGKGGDSITDNMAAVVGGGVAMVAIIGFLGYKVCCSSDPRYTEENLRSSSTASVGGKIELNDVYTKKDSDFGGANLEHTANPMSEKKKKKKKKKKKRDEDGGRRVSVQGGLLMVDQGDGMGAAPPPPPPPPPMPEKSQWERFIDPNSQQPYWYNKETGDTTWEKPEGEE